jgi:hypothetical protein
MTGREIFARGSKVFPYLPLILTLSHKERGE